MARLIYATPMSLDGYIGDGNYEWSAPSDEALAFITDVMRPVGTYLYGRKMYQTMAVWETPEFIPNLTPAHREYARVWQSANKIIYSKSLNTVATKRSRLKRDFDAKVLRELKSRLATDISIGGPNLAAQAMHAGLVDEYHLFVVPVMLGEGLPALPGDNSVQLDLFEARGFGNGWIYLRYRTRL